MDKSLLKRLFLVSVEKFRIKWSFITGGRQSNFEQAVETLKADHDRFIVHVATAK